MLLLGISDLEESIYSSHIHFDLFWYTHFLGQYFCSRLDRGIYLRVLTPRNIQLLLPGSGILRWSAKNDEKIFISSNVFAVYSIRSDLMAARKLLILCLVLKVIVIRVLLCSLVGQLFEKKKLFNVKKGFDFVVFLIRVIFFTCE